jgi:hypothetical protein
MCTHRFHDTGEEVNLCVDLEVNKVVFLMVPWRR